MGSPDLSSYKNLTLYDVLPADLVSRAVTDAAAKLPEWTPREGNTEMVLIEALSLVVAELVFAVNRMPGAIVEILAQLFSVTRGLGTPPTTSVTFTMVDSQGYTVPAGTVVRLTVGSATVDFTTDDAVVTTPGGATTATVSVTATTSTDAVNGVPAGTALTVVTPLFFVNSAQTAADMSAGALPEDDASWLDRFIAVAASLSSALANASQFQASVGANPLVYRVKAIDNWDADTSTTTGGHITVAVLGTGGATLSASDKASILADLQAKAVADLTIHVTDPTITAVDVTCAVVAADGYDTATVQANVEAAITGYLSTDTWDWSATVRRNKLIAVIEQADGVDYLDTLTTPAADVTLSGAAPLATAGTLTVSVS